MEAKPDFKAMSTQKKLGYVWDYYRFHILGTIVLVIVFGSIIHHYATLKTAVLDMIFLNAYTPEDDRNPFAEFLAEQGYDPNEYEVYLATTLGYTFTEDGYQADYTTLQAISAMFSTGDMDVFATPPQVFDEYASAGYVADLSTIFTEEELAPYSDKIIYSTLTETGMQFPAAFNLNDCNWLQDYGYYDGDYYMAVTANSDSPDLTKEFILYILQYE